MTALATPQSPAAVEERSKFETRIFPLLVWCLAVLALGGQTTLTLSLLLVVGFAVVNELFAQRHQSGVVTATGFLIVLTVLVWGLSAGLIVALTSTLLGDGFLRRRPLGLVLWHSGLLSLMVAAGAVATDSADGFEFLARPAGLAPLIWIAIYSSWFIRRILTRGYSVGSSTSGLGIIGLILLAVTDSHWSSLAGEESRLWIEAGIRGMSFAAAFMLVDFGLASLTAKLRAGPAALLFWLEHLPVLFFRYSLQAVAGGLTAYWYLSEGTIALVVSGAILIVGLAAYAMYQRLADLTESVMNAFGEAIDARDPYTAGHSQRVSVYATQFATHLGWSRARVDVVRRAGLVHDIGKIGVSDRTLFKPGRLEPHEFEEMKRHASIGESVVMRVTGLGRVATIAGQDHERWAGGGYPRGLAGNEIVPEARLLAIVDVYDAMTTTRPYREALDEDAVLAHLDSVAGEQLDPEMTRVFTDLVREKRDSGVLFCFCASH